MKILALETATVTGSVAIIDDSTGLIGEVRTDVKIVHAERLMPSIQWLLDTSRISIREIDAFAVSIGPGSFTGLRIGLSTAKGFSYAAGKPLVPVPTLDAFARTVPFCSHIICPVLDAGKNEVYAAHYRWENGGLRKISPEKALSPLKLVEETHGPVLFMGGGARKYMDVLKDGLKEDAAFAPPSRMSPSASTVAEIAVEMINEGIETDPVGLVPFYIRKSEAEINWQQ